jgi:hemolysin III
MRAFSPAERAVDFSVHCVGVVASLVAGGWLIAVSFLSSVPAVVASLAVYGLGLAATFASSAAYNLARPGRLKEVLRRLDHAMIYLMIAGTYTPFAILSLDGTTQTAVMLTVWTAAAVGIVIKILYPRRFERAAMMLYLGMGWTILAALDSLIESLSTLSLSLLVLGGVLYTLGTIVYAQDRWPFHRAIWHAMVLVAASLHYAAIVIEYSP